MNDNLRPVESFSAGRFLFLPGVQPGSIRRQIEPRASDDPATTGKMPRAPDSSIRAGPSGARAPRVHDRGTAPRRIIEHSSCAFAMRASRAHDSHRVI